LIDCRKINTTAKNNAKLTAGRLSKRTKEKLCQYVATDEKSEKIKEKKLINPDRLKSDESMLRDGINPISEAKSVAEKINILLKTKRRSSL
jgi:hypothetical protein